MERKDELKKVYQKYLEYGEPELYMTLCYIQEYCPSIVYAYQDEQELIDDLLELGVSEESTLEWYRV